MSLLLRFGNMSKIGKLPITIPEGINITINSSSLFVSGKDQQFTINLPPQIKAEISGNILTIKRLSESKQSKSNHGAIRANIQNIVTGFVTPWQKNLELIGTGYKTSVSGNKVILNVGFIKPVSIDIPEGLKVTAPSETQINIVGVDKVKVGQLASNIHKVRPPEPYKGKGIRYQNEFIKLKAGKTAKGSA